MSLFKSFKSVTGIAKSALGGVSNFRDILDAAPGLTKLAFPPQVQLGIKAASLLGLRLPDSPQAAADLILGKGKVDNILGSLKNTTKSVETTLGQLTIKVNGIEKTANSVEEVINSIDWLK